MKNQKHKFSLPDDVNYFNVAYMSPLLKTVEEVGIEALKKKKNPLDVTMEDFFGKVAELKANFGKLIHAPAQQIAVIPSVSYGMANVVQNLDYKSDGQILYLDEQFPSNYYPWEMAAKENSQSLLCIKAGNNFATRVTEWNDNILSAINSKTTAVCLSHVHWADGSLFDLSQISKKCQENNCYLVIDGTQSVGALPLHLDEIHFDALIVGGYKWLLGHYGLGLAYYSPKFDKGTPIEHNWINKQNSDNFAALVNYEDNYQSGAARYSMGEQSNFTHVAMLNAGIQQILTWGVADIQNYCRHLHKILLDNLKDTGFLVQDLNASSSHLVGIRISDKMSMHSIKEKLSAEKIFVSYRGDAIRVSLHVFNTVDDVEKLTTVLKSAIVNSMSNLK